MMFWVVCLYVLFVICNDSFLSLLQTDLVLTGKLFLQCPWPCKFTGTWEDVQDIWSFVAIYNVNIGFKRSESLKHICIFYTNMHS